MPQADLKAARVRPPWWRAFVRSLSAQKRSRSASEVSAVKNRSLLGQGQGFNCPDIQKILF